MHLVTPNITLSSGKEAENLVAENDKFLDLEIEI